MKKKMIDSIPYKLAESRGRTVRRRSLPVAKIRFSTKSCPRISVSTEVMEELAYPHTVQVGLSEKGIILSHKLIGAKGETKYFRLKQFSTYHVIESTSLVKEINEFFNLKYKDKITLKYDDVEFFNEGSRMVAHIPLIKREG